MNNYLRPSPSPMDKRDVYEAASAMIEKEEYYRCHNYLQRHLPLQEVQRAVSCRSKVCEWMFQVADCLELEREIAKIGMSFLDRFLCTDSPLAREAAAMSHRQYTLAAITCLYIAMKMFSGQELDAAVLCHTSELYTAEAVISAELEILSYLQWRLNGPTALQFVDGMIGLLPDSLAAKLASAMYDHCRLQTELAVGDFSLVGLDRSTIAVASILNSVAQVRFPLQKRIEYMDEIAEVFGINVGSPAVFAARQRLLDGLLVIQAENCKPTGLVPTEIDVSHQDQLKPEAVDPAYDCEVSPLTSCSRRSINLVSP